MEGRREYSLHYLTKTETMISVKNVYNTVLYAINKEQRGYVGPDEFNKFANLAQLKIFEQYFSDLATMSIHPKGRQMTSGYSDMVKVLKEKINVFSVEGAATYDSDSARFNLPSNLYRLDTVYYTADGYADCHELTKADAPMVLGNDLMKPTTTFPRFERFGDDIKVYPTSINSDIQVYYIKTPDAPNWAYNEAVSNATDGNLFYDAAQSTDFELHESEEYRLVYAILELAGLSTKEIDVVQYAQQAEQFDMSVKKG